MKRRWISFGVLAGLPLVLLLAVGLAQAQELEPRGGIGAQLALGTGFTYQGRLVRGGNPVNDTCDVQFSLWDAPIGGSQRGVAQTFGGVSVSDGFFAVNKVDFGADTLKGEARWLEVRVRCTGDGGYTVLGRHALNPAPAALALPGLWTQQNPTSPNLIGGYSGNSVAVSAVGATVGGGGVSDDINQVTASYGTVGGGYGNIAGGYAATVGGGYNNAAGGDYATVPGGLYADASHFGQVAHASGGFGEVGDAQGSLYVLRGITYGAAQTELFLDGGSQRLTVAKDRTLTFDILVVARSGAPWSAGYAAQGVIENWGGGIGFVGTPIVTTLGDNLNGSFNVLAENDALVIKVAGPSGQTVRWVATVRTAEVAW